MQTDSALISELEYFEGDKSKVYPDSRKLPTIGVGHLLTKDELSSGVIIIGGESVIYGLGLSEPEIQVLLNQDLAQAEAAVNRLVKVQLNQDQWDALVSFCFNIGSGAFAGSCLLRCLNSGEFDQVPNQMRRWCKNHDGTLNQGLVRRREAEIKLWGA